MEKHKMTLYEKFIKRILDIVIALIALIALLPLIFIIALVGSIVLKGNPFFVQTRPGKDEELFKLIKFRTMSDKKDSEGNLLADELRLNKYGRILRSTSCDELPSLLNIVRGELSIVGPRPLLVDYLPLYNSDQKHRHDVKPGLTGLAQVNGRNLLSWEERFEKDIEYVNNISFVLDCSIIIKTIKTVFKREGISSKTSETMEDFKGTM